MGGDFSVAAAAWCGANDIFAADTLLVVRTQDGAACGRDFIGRLGGNQDDPFGGILPQSSRESEHVEYGVGTAGQTEVAGPVYGAQDRNLPASILFDEDLDLRTVHVIFELPAEFFSHPGFAQSDDRHDPDQRQRDGIVARDPHRAVPEFLDGRNRYLQNISGSDRIIGKMWTAGATPPKRSEPLALIGVLRFPTDCGGIGCVRRNDWI